MYNLRFIKFLEIIPRREWKEACINLIYDLLPIFWCGSYHQLTTIKDT